MFERYTEKARRVIFFARYEASQFGSPYIETEHLLLGLLRENKVLAFKLLKPENSVELIRKKIESRGNVGEKVSTSVDLPLSNECKRVLAYAAEEAERLSHKHIGTEHLLLGLLREKTSFGAQLLNEEGLALEQARQEIGSWPPELATLDRFHGMAENVRPQPQTIEIHGRKLDSEIVRDRISGVKKFAWIRRDWKPVDVVIDTLHGGVSFDLNAADGKRLQLVHGGWTKEPCAICAWLITQSAKPEENEAFTNGRQWLCTECYHRFVETKTPGTSWPMT